METEIKNYYEKLYGEPSRYARFVSFDEKEISIYKWNESQTNEGVVMYCTVGASTILGNDVLGCEFFIGMTPENDSIATAIAEVAHDGGGQNIPNIGDSITLAYPLWNDTEIKTFLFSDGNDIIPPMKLENKEIKFIQLVPLYDSELEFKKQHGADGLWDKFISMKTPYWDSERQPQSGVL